MYFGRLILLGMLGFLHTPGKAILEDLMGRYGCFGGPAALSPGLSNLLKLQIRFSGEIELDCIDEVSVMAHRSPPHALWPNGGAHLPAGPGGPQVWESRHAP